MERIFYGMGIVYFLEHWELLDVWYAWVILGSYLFISSIYKLNKYGSTIEKKPRNSDSARVARANDLIKQFEDSRRTKK